MTEPESRPAPPAAPARSGPWALAGAACPGGFSAWGWRLIAGWLAFTGLTSVLWELHLQRLTGWSSLPDYWGEMLTARDLWELMQNGGLVRHWTGPWTPLAALAALAGFLWAGWRLQARSADVPARFGAWFRGFLDALAVGAVPLLLLAAMAIRLLGLLDRTGLPALVWVHWAGSTLVRLGFLSALFLQWWLCRLARAELPDDGRLGGWAAWIAHLKRCGFQFWRHAFQWAALVLGGVVVRTGLSFLVLALAWRWGGGTVPRVVVFALLQLAVVGANAWLLGWFLRLVGLYHREGVRAASEDGSVPVGGA